MEAATALRRAVVDQETADPPVTTPEAEPRDIRPAEFATQVGPVITATHAERLASDNAVGYAEAQARYEHMDWAPTA